MTPDGYYSYGDFLDGARQQEAHVVEDSRTPPKTDHAHRPVKAPKRKRKRGARRVIGVVAVLVLAFCATLLAADFLLPNGVAGYVVETFAPTAPTVYAVSQGAYDTLSDARATSDMVRQRGGAGFVAYDGKYNVLVAAYPTQQEANAVAEKNGYSLYPIRTQGMSASDIAIAYRAKVKPLIDYHVDVYHKLYELSDQLAQEGTTEAYCKQRVAAIRQSLSNLAAPFLDAAKDSTDTATANYRSGVMATIASLDNLVNLDSDVFLADLRWTYIMILRINRI